MGDAMDDIEAALRAFESGEADKCDAVASVADLLNERVVSLFWDVLVDKGEDEIVRVEILKSLLFRKDSPADRVRFGDAVRRILHVDDDTLVRQYAAIAMRLFVDTEGAVELLEQIVRDESEDLDVRHNALGAFEANADEPRCRESLARLVQDPVFGKSAQRVLRRGSELM